MRSHEEHVRGTHWEIIWNLMGTQQIFYENNKNSTMPPSLERKKKTWVPLGACYFTSLVARILFAYMHFFEGHKLWV
jgi:hypothetical protein